MSRLAELRNCGTTPRTDEKKFISLENDPTEPTKGASVGSVGSIPRSMKFFSQSATAADTQTAQAGNAVPVAESERRCYQCQHFTRSSYGFPIGLCRQYGSRIQHVSSQPTRFGCGGFVLRDPADDNRACLACRHYSQSATTCDVVHTGCPYPAIPPCSSTKFQPGGNRP